MNDRELLEAAALAIGWRWSMADVCWYDDAAGTWNKQWNPLTDDGDALRLAVKLHFTLRCYMGNTCAQTTVPGGPSVDVDETNHADPYAATRRAIVCAAAALHKARQA